MPGTAPPVRSEAEGLIAYLRQQRDGLLNAALGLTEEQLRLAPTRSTLSVGGLLKHAARTERQWVDLIAGRPPSGGEQEYLDGFVVTAEDSAASLTAALREAGAATEAVVAGLPDLGVEVSLPRGPWYPRGDGYTARWVLLHVLEELSRHAGHADLVREHVDGATMHALMAAAEGWPEDGWVKPWRPASGGRPGR